MRWFFSLLPKVLGCDLIAIGDDLPRTLICKPAGRHGESALIGDDVPCLPI